MIYFGIDIGKNGAISMEINNLVSVIDMPVKRTKGKLELNVKEIRKIFAESKKLDDVVVFIEKQQPFPKQGVVSMFTLGKEEGFFEGLFTALEIEYLFIKPKDWQKFFMLKGKKKNVKKEFKLVSKMFPELEFKSEKGKLLDGRMDAVLIMEYGKKGGVNESKRI